MTITPGNNKLPVASQTMTTEEARGHLERLGWTQGDFATFFECGDRTARRWLSLKERLPIPRGVAFALTELTPAKAKKWMAGNEG